MRLMQNYPPHRSHRKEGDMSDSNVYWLIERGSPAEFLGIEGSLAFDNPIGRFVWTTSSFDALRFNRKQDALLFVGAMRVLSNRMILAETVRGLRQYEEMPRICDHQDMP